MDLKDTEVRTNMEGLPAQVEETKVTHAPGVMEEFVTCPDNAGGSWCKHHN